MASVKEYLSAVAEDRDTVLWGLTLVGLCVLVGLGKVKQEMLEYMMMAIVGRASQGKRNAE